MATITLRLERHEAEALAQMAKRFGYDHAVHLSSQFTKYDGLPEHDVMLEAVVKLQHALSEKGFAPR